MLNARRCPKHPKLCSVLPVTVPSKRAKLPRFRLGNLTNTIKIWLDFVDRNNTGVRLIACDTGQCPTTKNKSSSIFRTCNWISIQRRNFIRSRQDNCMINKPIVQQSAKATTNVYRRTNQSSAQSQIRRRLPLPRNQVIGRDALWSLCNRRTYWLSRWQWLHCNSAGEIWTIAIADNPHTDLFKAGLWHANRARTDYLTFIKMCADTGISKWVISMAQMTCTYIRQSRK